MSAIIAPFSERHAIKNVLFVFEFSRPVTSVELSELKAGTALHEQIKETLPKVTEQQQMVVNLGQNVAFGLQSASAPQELSGVSFESVMPNGEPALGLNIQNRNLFLICGVYSRWAEVFSRVEEVVRLISSWLNKHGVEASNFVLQYLNEFKVSFKDGNPKPLVSLFNVSSPYIVSNFASVTGAFHSHHGFFSSPEHSIPGRLLTNVNVNVAELPALMNAQVQTTHKYMASQPVKIAGSEGFSQQLRDAYWYLHQENKKVMCSLLTEDIKASISIDSGSARNS